MTHARRALSFLPLLVLAAATTFAAITIRGRESAQTSSDHAASRPAATGASPRAVELRDYTQSPVIDDSERDAPRRRIVSLAPNVSEMCAALGLADQLVGRTRFCTHPPQVQHAKPLGGVQDLNAETLLSLKPDLVLVKDQSGGVPDRLAALNLHFETIPDTRLEDVFVGIRKLGSLTGRPKSAESLCNALRGDLDRVCRRYKAPSTTRVLFLTGVMSDPPQPPFVAGPGSYFDDLLRLAGHVNAAPEARAYGSLSLEVILNLDPDAIIELDDRDRRRDGDALARDVWRKIGPLKAVAAGRVRVISGAQHYLAGPRMAHTLLAICQALEQRGD